MIRLLIVDDHHIVVSGIRAALASQDSIEVVATAGTARECLEIVCSMTIDVALLDINLPDKDGIDLCKEVKTFSKKTRVIGLTTYSQVSFIEQMVRNGADGYLYKNTSEVELIKAIETVHSGEQYFSNEVYQKLLNKSRRLGKKQFIPKLTRREKEVLDLIAEEYTSQEIANKLFISLSTVETHRMNLCSKVDARNTAGLIKKGIKLGLI